MIRIKTLSNGIRVATDQMDSVRSCSLGIYLEVGSRFERTRPEHGLTHFIEHMLFKGTPNHDALTLADELNRLGGNVNAHTSHENLCLHARCVDEKTPRVLDLLAEMLLGSTYPQEEISRERNVILEEYKMYEDMPDELVYDMFFQTMWPNTSLGHPIIGTPTSINRFSQKQIREYVQREFHPSRLIIVLAGSFDLKDCMQIIKQRFESIPSSKLSKPSAREKIEASGKRQRANRGIEQMHFCLGGAGPERGSKDRYHFGMMNMVLGGGMSSRLFKEVREKRGLAYSINSFVQPFRGTGAFGISGSTSPDTADEVMRIIFGELDLICKTRVTEDELELAREQLVDSLLMSVESTSSRMGLLGESLRTYGRYVPPEEIVEHIRQVTPAQVQKAAKKYLVDQPITATFVGPKGTNLKSLDCRSALTAA